MDKFIQPTHLYLHSNPLDYPETAKARNQHSSADWDQTVVVYEAFRAPVFIPDYLKEKHENGLFDIAIPRDKFNGTDEEYYTQLPGQIMDKWSIELQTGQVVRFIDELNTPGAKIPQYLNIQHCENVWRMSVRADSVYKIWTESYVSQYYDKVDDFFFWNRIPAKEQVDYVFQKEIWKLKPEYEDRMITAGYSKDVWNKSLGKYFDIERAF